MKKIFTLMLALACAMFVGVSCTPDGSEDNYTSTVTVTGAPEANLAPEAGELTLGYSITNPSLTAALSVTTEAAWVHVGEVGETSVALTYDANTNSPGSEAREAVVVFAYEGAKTVNVTLKQDSTAPSFTVEFSELTMSSANMMVTSVDPEMDWIALTGTTSAIAEVGTPEEYVMSLYNAAAAEGMPYLYLMSQVYMQGGAMGKGSSTEPAYIMKPWNAGADEELYVFVLGFNVNADLVDWAYDNSTLATAPHVFKVPLLAAPKVVVAEADLNKSVSSAAGTLEIAYTLENPIEGNELYLESSADWLTATVAEGKIVLNYLANETAVSRRAKVTVNYGDWLITPFDITVSQEKDPNAVAVTLNIEVTGTQFNGIWVNVTPSDPNVTYALNTKAVESDWETGAPLETDWATEAENLLSYVGNATFHQGNLTGHFIKMTPGNYAYYGYDYNVWGVAVNATSEETTDYYGNPKTVWTVTGLLSEVFYTKATIDASQMPKLEWDTTKNPELVWNENNGRYDLEAVEGSTVVLHYVLTNPAEGGMVTLNGTSLYDYYNVVDGEPVIDNAAGTITFKIDKFDTAKSYHYVSPTFKYTNEAGDNWSVTTPSLRITQVQAPAVTGNVKIESIADLTAGEYYAGGYSTSYQTNDWSANPYHMINGITTDLYTTPYSYTDGVLVKKEGEQYDAAVVTLEAVAGKENTYYVKVGSDYLTSTAASNRSLAKTSTPAEWVASNNSKGGISLKHVETGVYLGTAGATSKMCRSYTNESTLVYGLVFFTK